MSLHECPCVQRWLLNPFSRAEQCLPGSGSLLRVWLCHAVLSLSRSGCVARRACVCFVSSRRRVAGAESAGSRNTTSAPDLFWGDPRQQHQAPTCETD